MSDIQKAAQRLKREFARQNDAALRDMARVYGKAWKRLKADFDRLSKQVAEAKAAGEFINFSWLFRLNRYNQLMMQLEQELVFFSRYAAAMVGDQQAHALIRGAQHAEALMAQSLGQMPDELIRLGYRVTWSRAPREALANLIGYLSDGSPLSYKFTGLATETAQGIRDAIAVGFVTGQNPRTIARTVKRAFDGGLVNALTVCRTETMRAYRTAAHESYRANDDIVTGWIWSAARNTRTCAGCWAMDGTFHKLTEELVDHPNGCCVAIPVTKPWSELAPGAANIPDTSVKPWKSSQFFDKLSESDKLKVLGSTRYNLLASGKITIEDVRAVTKSSVWGDHIRPRTVKELISSGVVSREDAIAARVAK